MRSTCAIWTFSLVACGKGEPATKLPPVVASMEYTSKTVGTNRACMDIYDANAIETWAKFCTTIDVGARSKCTFHRGRACTPEAHRGGCLQRDGSINWLYEGETSCVFGTSFPGEPPAPVAAKPFHCKGPNTCQDMASVFDLVPTVEAKNCATSGGVFGPGACPVEGALGRCRMEGVDRVVMTFYPPATVEKAKQACTSFEGEWL